MTDRPTVVDVSHYQSEPPWRELVDAGIIGVILKATEGTTYLDDTYYRRAIDAQDAGLLVSTYHFLHHGAIDQQMMHYLDAIEPVEGERVCLDYEDENLVLDDLELAVYWLKAERSDLQITCYGSAKLTEDALFAKSDSPLTGTSLWIARYSDNSPDIADNVWPVWSLWQYTDRGTVAGWGPVDCNRFNGSDENLRNWLSPAVPGPEPIPVADVEISVRPGLRVVVNGVAIDT